MKIGYKGTYDLGVWTYVNGEHTNIHFYKTCYGSFKIFDGDAFVAEEYTIEQTYNKIKEMITKQKEQL